MKLTNSNSKSQVLSSVFQNSLKIDQLSATQELVRVDPDTYLKHDRSIENLKETKVSMELVRE